MGIKAAKVLDAIWVYNIPLAKMRTHQQIIDDAKGLSALARSVGAAPNTAKQWRRNDSIPATYWAAIASNGFASLEELADAAEAKRTAGGIAA